MHTFENTRRESCTHEMEPLRAVSRNRMPMVRFWSICRSVGEAFLRKMGVAGAHIQELFLERQLEIMFHEIDADGGGDIDFEEMADGLQNMGVRSEQEGGQSDRVLSEHSGY